jgi:hypothetical protein
VQGDVLAGVLALLEQWMMEAVLPNFRDTKALAEGLSVTARWFDDAEVQASIESLDVKGSPLAQVEERERERERQRESERE